ncbi:hypothetical protein I315_03931 [Cryptococcus gattii Ru294]|nr:hypothetical protein I315_03931 [Cryptococcus gattii Ru294]
MSADSPTLASSHKNGAKKFQGISSKREDGLGRDDAGSHPSSLPRQCPA